MERFGFYFCMLVIVGTLATLLLSMTGGSLFMLLPLALLVIPAMFGGLDLWHMVFRFLSRRSSWLAAAGEFNGLARFLLRWLIVSLPPAAVLLALHLLMPEQFTQFTTNWDALRFCLSTSIMYGFFNLPSVTRGEKAISLITAADWFRKSHNNGDCRA